MIRLERKFRHAGFRNTVTRRNVDGLTISSVQGISFHPVPRKSSFRPQLSLNLGWDEIDTRHSYEPRFVCGKASVFRIWWWTNTASGCYGACFEVSQLSTSKTSDSCIDWCVNIFDYAEDFVRVRNFLETLLSVEALIGRRLVMYGNW